ncbi:hypothetical protein [Chrysochromulina parva virus BQ2]|uniref:Uncharacterized protein n=1 Tax=Chrysochromulina parva virus BQ2 TaxID=3070831 RepID=A0A4Y6GRK2_9VIRU|nr:hypothetical protein QKE47_gp08 [Chrysochromulina parva virus]QDF45899.1 hypothetical protein [Chrysochromulina parva virus BQ2]
MYGYDPIFLEKRKLNEWLQESEDNILVIFDKNSLKFSASPNDSMKNKSQDKVFCLKKQFLFNPEIKDIYLKCIIENDQLMVKKTYANKTTYNNIGYYVNKNVLIDIKTIKPSLHEKRIFKVSINSYDEDKNGDNMYISKETLALSKIGVFKNKEINALDKKIINKNIPYKEDVYFEKLLSNALFDYSYKWDGPINSYLRLGLPYFLTPIFNQTYKVYGDTKKNACFAILAKVEDLDRAFLEAAPRHEDSEKAYFRGMKQPFENFTKEGDSITVQNFMSITTNFKVAVGFSGIRKGGQTKCCVYKIIISNGVPYINMVNTTKYKAENETLLPRNLKLTLIKNATLPHQYYGEIPIIVVRVSLQNNDQFKIPSGCKKFYLGKLISVKSSYLDVISKTETETETKPKNKTKTKNKTKNEIIEPRLIEPIKVIPERKKNITKSKSKRCPNGTRINKLTGNCEAILTNSVKKENKPLKQKTKSKRCPNGTRKNKISGLCEKINGV